MEMSSTRLTNLKLDGYRKYSTKEDINIDAKHVKKDINTGNELAIYGDSEMIYINTEEGGAMDDINRENNCAKKDVNSEEERTVFDENVFVIDDEDAKKDVHGERLANVDSEDGVIMTTQHKSSIFKIKNFVLNP